jgi:hypothetical protein
VRAPLEYGNISPGYSSCLRKKVNVPVFFFAVLSGGEFLKHKQQNDDGLDNKTNASYCVQCIGDLDLV